MGTNLRTVSVSSAYGQIEADVLGHIAFFNIFLYSIGHFPLYNMFSLEYDA